MTAGATPRKNTTRDVLRALRRPKVLAMLLLGFSSGLPLYLVGNTMGYWTVSYTHLTLPTSDLV